MLGAVLGITGCDLRLGEPRFLWLLWLIPLLALFFAYSIERRRQLAARLVAPALLATLAAGQSRARLWLKAVLMLGAMTALVVAMTLPKYGFAWEDVQRRGIDLVVAFDVSSSMLATDDGVSGTTSRLERAKRKIHDLVGMLDGDRVALVPFAGAAYVACPLTVDYAAFLSFVDEMDPDVVSAKGTSLSVALRASLEAFAGGAGESRAILIISDGEQTTGDAHQAAAAAREQGVRVYAIGVGSTEGAPIPAENGSFRRNQRGELVLSQLDEPGLEAAALDTGGAYARAVASDRDLETIYKQGIKGAVKSRDLEGHRRQKWHERYQWLVGLALLLLGAEWLIPERVRKKDD